MGKLVQCVDFIVSLRNSALAADAGLLFHDEDSLCNKKINNLYSSAFIIRIRWAGCVVRMKQTRKKSTES